MKYLSTAYTYISISGKNLDTDDFIYHFCINPTEIGENRQGEKFLDYKVEAKDANEGLDQAIEILMHALTPKSKEIKTYVLKKNLYIKIFVVIYGKNEESNGVFFNKDFIKFVGDLGAEIEIDIYPAGSSRIR